MSNAVEFSEKPTEGEPWDVGVVGSGPSGLTSAIYTTRGAASTILIAGEKWGGQLMLTTDVDNYPGFPEGILGPDLMAKMRKQAERFGTKIVEKNVTSVDFSQKPFKLQAGDQTYLAKSVIVAVGAETMWLGVTGEDKLRGRGISSCAPCDAPFFKDKKVAVIGGGDSAMEESLVLAKYANSVTIFHRRDKFRASAAMQRKVFDNKKIKVVWNTTVEEFLGQEKLEKLKLKNVKSGGTREEEFGGAFVAIGHKPSTEIFKGQLELDEKGYMKRTKCKGQSARKYKMATSVPGVFVAGDVHDYSYRQAVTAAGFGCMAAMEVLRYLESL